MNYNVKNDFTQKIQMRFFKLKVVKSFTNLIEFARLNCEVKIRRLY